MAKESIIVLSLLGGGFIVTLVGGIMWALKKKIGIFIAVIGVVILFSSFLFIPESDNKKGVDSSSLTVEKLDFSECYYAYKENELRADDTYKGNRYSLTVQVRDIQNTDDSLLYWDDEVIIEFEIMVDNTHVVGEALFEKEQTDSLKNINVGDTITFVGECQSAGAWINCELD